MKATPNAVQIRTYELEAGLLHLERGAVTDEEVTEMYGPISKAWDGEMPANTFFNLPDFRDL